MNDRQRLEAIIGVVCKYLPPDGIPANEAMSQIIALVDPLPEPVQKPVACAVCNEIHAILDADESKIIRDAKDGYPDGRRPRTLTLQERITALCVYASDWKRWCLEKENTTPPAQPAVLSLEDSLKVTKVCCGDYANCHAPCTPRGRWQAHQEPAAWVGLTHEEIDDACWEQANDLLDHIYQYGTAAEGITRRIHAIARAIEAKLREKNGGGA